MRQASLVAAEIIFWLCAVGVIYAYLGYPLLLVIASRLRSLPVRKAEIWPRVTVIITAYNEENALARKLDNTLSLDYPKDLLEIIVASDCSTDQTDEIVRSFESQGVRLHRQPNRFGKTSAQNAAVEKASGEIIIFSDATTLYERDVLKVMVPSFADPGVGCVAGRLVYVDPSRTTVGQGARSYWGYESFLKRHESRVCSLIGASGCLYAVRRSAYVPMYDEACSDFLIATKMMEQDLRAVYEPLAICFEETNRQPSKELQMRVRVITQTFTDLWRHRGMMNPLRSGFYAIQLISHKVLRYLVPFFLVIMVLCSAILAWQSVFHFSVLTAVMVFAMLVLVAWRIELANMSTSVLTLPYYFVLANLASMLAVYKFLTGERYARWEPIRDPVDRPTASASATMPVGPEGRGQ
jgi:cellulose synthase/poly-beta-1,6-N-acetylglucosamine synthase-like glycosyltransferase